MKGQFKNVDDCIKELKNQNFTYYTSNDGIIYFYSKIREEIAEINIYSDKSASALIGRFSIKNN